jgi:hypothetical protein
LDKFEVIKALKKRHFNAIYVEDRLAAREELLRRIAPKSSVGIGGSMTIEALQIEDEVRERDCPVYWHWKSAPEEMFQVRKDAARANFFLTSTNALTEDGRLVNVDGVGNRVAAMIFGPEAVIVVAGINKIVPDLEAAMERIKRIATPLNARRLNLDVPCAHKGECVDCMPPGRICNVTTIIEGKPVLTDFQVILVGEELGY